MVSVARDYLSLTKPRVMPLLLIVTFASMIVAAEGNPKWTAVLATMVGGALAIGGAGALNGYIDRDLDGRMTRTRNRPIPSGRISPTSALIFGLTLGAGSILLLALTVNVLAAAITLGAVVYYAVIYSRILKLSTTQNIVIGGAAGAAPVLIGWAAVTDGLGLTPLVLFAIIFYWTPPHFWALALLIRDDYQHAGVPMLPAVVGDKETKRRIVLYTLLMIPFTLILVPVSNMGLFYLAVALALGALFLALAIRLARSDTARAARNLFSYSMLYLALLFGAMAADQQIAIPL